LTHPYFFLGTDEKSKLIALPSPPFRTIPHRVSQLGVGKTSLKHGEGRLAGLAHCFIHGIITRRCCFMGNVGLSWFIYESLMGNQPYCSFMQVWDACSAASHI